MKILMTAMSLDIGGAETHIVELTKELARRGVGVTVASNGGVYAAELEKAGIRHIKLPLHSKHPYNVFRCYTALYRLIKNERYDVVHAHARIPAFICGLLAKRLHFRFVTTCHGVFKITPFWRAISDWGERSLAVSSDIKQYLIDNYGLVSDNITLTINGIDTERFAVKRFSKNGHRVIYDSRIDRESAHVAFILVETAADLRKIYPDIEIVIAGGGTALDELKAAAAKVNGEAGSDFIKLTGPVTDINKLLQTGDVFVGVSRAALEAMSTALPVILAGSQGYIGVFGEDRIRTALDTNFCCRGCGLPTPELIKNDIITVFEKTDSERESMGIYNRSVVEKYFTIGRMADDALFVYGLLTPYRYYKYGDVVISGYYGFGNTGDDSLLAVIISELRRECPDIKLTVLSRNPRLTGRVYGVRSINRFNIFSVAKATRHARLLINGSGNLIQNGTSNRSLMYYIGIMRLAAYHRLRIMMYASGIGPIKGGRYRKAARDILDRTDLISLRENDSAKELVSLGVTNKNVTVTADPAYRIEPAAAEWIGYVMNREHIKTDGAYFAVALRSWPDVADDYEKKLADALIEIHNNGGGIPLFIPMQASADLPLCRRVAAAAGGRVIKGLTASELIGLFSYMNFVVAMRLHSAIYAASAGVPFIGLAYDMKINAMAAEYGLPYNIDVRFFTSEALVSMAGDIMRKRAELTKLISARAAQMRARAGTDAAAAVALLHGK